MNILVINAGSSSLKYQLLNPDTQEVLAKGLCERIGLDGKFTYKPAGKEAVKDADVSMPTHSEAIQTVLRREGYPNPYEALKALTRTNNKITQESIAEFIDTLDISAELKKTLKQITPSNYTGI